MTGGYYFDRRAEPPINFHSSMKLYGESLRLQSLPLIENGVFSNSVNHRFPITPSLTQVPSKRNLLFERSEKKHRESMFTFLPAPYFCENTMVGKHVAMTMGVAMVYL